ncbi:MAG: hypothetical protein LBQ91_00780 [Oscillospiraceae bacterium]|jgi:hypothetical protein|nr:hypothetical protein [Oscillospiraceae bacterium]
MKKMKSAGRTLLALLLTALLTLTLTACGNDNPPPATDTPPETVSPTAPETTPEPTPPQTDVDWNAIYLNWELQNPNVYTHSDPIRFVDAADSFGYLDVKLIDVNGDGVPELEMDPANPEISYPYVYTIVNGKVTQLAGGARIYKYAPTGEKVIAVWEGENANQWWGTELIYDRAFYFVERGELVKAYDTVTILDTGVNEKVDETENGTDIYDFDPVEQLMHTAEKYGYPRPTTYVATEGKYGYGGNAQAYYIGKRNIPYEEYDAMLEEIGGEFSFDLSKVDTRKTVSDVAGEVKHIKAIWDGIVEDVSYGFINKVSVRRGVTAFWMDIGNDGEEYLLRIDVAAGTDDISYSRIYIFDEFTSEYATYTDVLPCFSFWSGKEDSHRLYFSEGYLFRWRYTAPDGTHTDYDNASYDSEFLRHEREALKEAKALLQEALDKAPTD